MASSSGTSSRSVIQLRNYGSKNDDHLQQVINQRKRKRLISNRESARRSRMRKQKYLDDLMAEMSQLKEENNQIVTNINMVDQLYLNVKAENSVLKAQMAELSHRLQSLKEIIDYKTSANAATTTKETEDLWNYYGENMNNIDINGGDDSLNLLHVNQLTMASNDEQIIWSL
ncbi:bZIP transcription factor 44-like [Nicotiana tabacum]|uniref:BZIP transcription factor 44-like n=2 Tax=Nicotiana TaxID=4085 RepID=A0A1S4CKY8_TOBAC|nr:PREDICTED: ocs element-binding factor 1-like [Nicotiana sylvestris]XP_016501594.1 PREDICTED: bZIP transcription factor 53-like [Nicotiana tabacum]